MVKDIEVPNILGIDRYNLRSENGSIINDSDKFGGNHSSSVLIIDGQPGQLEATSEKMTKVWYKVYESYIPDDVKSKSEIKYADIFKASYARVKNMFDTLGPIKVFEKPGNIYNFDDAFACKYVDANENLGPFTYRFKMLNPIYNKVGRWWLGDKGQPIMAAPNNMDSYDSEPVVPKSYNDYLMYTANDLDKIDMARQKIEHSGKLEFYELIPIADVIVKNPLFRSDGLPGCDYKWSSLPTSQKYRIKTPLEFMSPYNPDVLVPEDKLNELAKEHPEVWKPMIFEYNGYKSICVSANGYIISAYQPAPNVYLPIHIYGLSDHRGPYGYDAAKSVIITIKNLVLYTDHGKDEIYHEPDTNDAVLVDSNAVKKAYDDIMEVVGQ